MTSPEDTTAPAPAGEPDGHGTLHSLRRAGFPLDAMPPEQVEVLASLTPDEVGLLLSVKERLDACEPEVLAHGEIAGGALF